jgi:hypothetical protein
VRNCAESIFCGEWRRTICTLSGHLLPPKRLLWAKRCAVPPWISAFGKNQKPRPLPVGADLICAGLCSKSPWRSRSALPRLLPTGALHEIRIGRIDRPVDHGLNGENLAMFEACRRFKGRSGGCAYSWAKRPSQVVDVAKDGWRVVWHFRSG